MTKRIVLFFNTIRYLKPVQIYYRLYFKLFKTPIITFYKKRWTKYSPESRKLILRGSIPSKESTDGKSFIFLNLPKMFDTRIDWNYHKHGKLWTYKLNYFDYINSEKVPTQVAESLIEDFCSKFSTITIGMDPYPVSLRSINWIKFFVRHGRPPEKWTKNLYSQLKALCWLTEYHLLGNHLLENGFALLFGGYYFENRSFYKKAQKILYEELDEQILKDGGHFERSPMYHCIILEGLLDCYNLLQSNSSKDTGLNNFISEKAAAMLGWLEQVTLKNGMIPTANDTIECESATPQELLSYGEFLGIVPKVIPLNESGYRLLQNNRYELFIDIGDIGPDYIPGHSHSDTFSFLLFSRQQPLIVEAGTSTYQPGIRRLLERSTRSHNTVMVNGKDQSEVWSSFRVGRRAKVVSLKENANKITGTHNGYEFMGILHQRSWEWDEDKIIILDKLDGNSENVRAQAFLHFHPDVRVEVDADVIRLGSSNVKVEGQQSLQLEDYDYALGFNKTIKGKVLNIHFKDQLRIVISV